MTEFIIIFVSVIVIVLYVSSQLPDQNENLIDNIKKLDKDGITKNEGKG
tara:strand:+ start:1314 stop:1460 length:147 start_codon:yes stop_codon:yes gene_type:complete